MVAHISTNPPLATPLVLDHHGLAQLGITTSNAALLRLERDGLFPRRFRLPGSNRSLWLHREIAEHIRSAAAARDLAKQHGMTAPATAERQRRRKCAAQAPTP